MSFRHDLRGDGPAVGLWGWDRQCCPVPQLLIADQWMLGRQRQLTHSTIGFSSPWVLAGMLQQERGKDLGGDTGVSSQPNQCFSAYLIYFSQLDTDGGCATDLLKETPAHAVGEDAVSWISHLTPPFSVFQQSGLAARRKGRERQQLCINEFIPYEKPGRG